MVQLRREAMCIFSAFMSFLGALPGALNILAGNRLAVVEFGSPVCEFVVTRDGGIEDRLRHRARLPQKPAAQAGYRGR
jgi:hypothetical protein